MTAWLAYLLRQPTAPMTFHVHKVQSQCTLQVVKIAMRNVHNFTSPADAAASKKETRRPPGWHLPLQTLCGCPTTMRIDASTAHRRSHSRDNLRNNARSDYALWAKLVVCAVHPGTSHAWPTAPPAAAQTNWPAHLTAWACGTTYARSGQTLLVGKQNAKPKGHSHGMNAHSATSPFEPIQPCSCKRPHVMHTAQLHLSSPSSHALATRFEPSTHQARMHMSQSQTTTSTQHSANGKPRGRRRAHTIQHVTHSGHMLRSRHDIKGQADD